MQKHENSRNFHGKIISGNKNHGCNVKFDNFPVDDQMVHIRRRNIMVVIEEGGEEVKCNHVNVDINTDESDPKKNEYKECAQKFCDLSDDEIMKAITFTLKDAANEIVFDILLDGECIELDEIKLDCKQ